jgi:hypothetical protein
VVRKDGRYKSGEQLFVSGRIGQEGRNQGNSKEISGRKKSREQLMVRKCQEIKNEGNSC